MINNYQTEIMKIYEKVQDEEANSLRMRKSEIEKKLPQITQLEQAIGKLCVELSISSFKDIENRELHLKQLKEKITDLRIQKTELLVQHGYGLDYLDMHYRCNKCKDTGFIGNKKCTCYKQKLVQLYYRNSDLDELLKNNNFSNFSFELYSSKKAGEEPESPRRNIEKVHARTLNFINNFDSSNENLLFYGSSGTGKTFLSNCIAKELLDKGLLVVYRTAEDLIKNLRTIKFENDSILEDLIVNCDLLIIDDLGTEQQNDFSKTEFFNLLNKKLLKDRKMIVSTNCTLEDLLKNYSERITSRLIGNFTLCKFYGDDIRIKKNLSKIR